MQDVTFADNVKQVPIVILNWNGWEDTISCINSIYAAEVEPLIWVVDNKSDLDKSEDLKKKHPNVIFIMNDKNYGWAVANNIAIDIAKRAGHSHIYLLNNDCLVEAGFLSSSLQQMEDDTATIGSYIVSLDGDSVIFDGEYADGEQAVSRQNILKSTAKVNGAGMLINIAAFYQTGEFDARYFCYQEETEWCERATKSEGFKVKLNQASVIRHAREGSNVGGNSIYYRNRNSFIQTKVRSPHMPILVDMILGNARQSKKEGNVVKYEALMCALQDGLAKKFSVRTSIKVRFPYRFIEWMSGEIGLKHVVKEYYKWLFKISW